MHNIDECYEFLVHDGFFFSFSYRKMQASEIGKGAKERVSVLQGTKKAATHQLHA